MDHVNSIIKKSRKMGELGILTQLLYEQLLLISGFGSKYSNLFGRILCKVSESQTIFSSESHYHQWLSYK
jgi:hypothetical protein